MKVAGTGPAVGPRCLDVEFIVGERAPPHPKGDLIGSSFRPFRSRNGRGENIIDRVPQLMAHDGSEAVVRLGLEARRETNPFVVVVEETEFSARNPRVDSDVGAQSRAETGKCVLGLLKLLGPSPGNPGVGLRTDHTQSPASSAAAA